MWIASYEKSSSLNGSFFQSHEWVYFLRALFQSYPSDILLIAVVFFDSVEKWLEKNDWDITDS